MELGWRGNSSAFLFAHLVQILQACSPSQGCLGHKLPTYVLETKGAGKTHNRSNMHGCEDCCCCSWRSKSKTRNDPAQYPKQRPSGPLVRWVMYPIWARAPNWPEHIWDTCRSSWCNCFSKIVLRPGPKSSLRWRPKVEPGTTLTRAITSLTHEPVPRGATCRTTWRLGW